MLPVGQEFVAGCKLITGLVIQFLAPQSTWRSAHVIRPVFWSALEQDTERQLLLECVPIHLLVLVGGHESAGAYVAALDVCMLLKSRFG